MGRCGGRTEDAADECARVGRGAQRGLGMESRVEDENGGVREAAGLGRFACPRLGMGVGRASAGTGGRFGGSPQRGGALKGGDSSDVCACLRVAVERLDIATDSARPALSSGDSPTPLITRLTTLVSPTLSAYSRAAALLIALTSLSALSPC